jgi:WD40 repeat protein
MRNRFPLIIGRITVADSARRIARSWLIWYTRCETATSPYVVLGHGMTLQSITLSVDGGSDDAADLSMWLGEDDDPRRHVRVRNIANPSAPILQETIAVASKAPLALALAPRKPLLAALCPDSGLCVWNVAKRGAPAVIAHMSGGISLPSPTVTSMAISPDGTLLAVGSINDGTLLFSIAQPADPRLLAVLPDHASNPSYAYAGVAFSPRGGLLAETVNSGATKLCARQVRDHRGGVRSCRRAGNAGPDDLLQ